MLYNTKMKTLDVSERKFWIENNSGEKLCVVETRPEKSMPQYPVVILCHGFAYYKEEDGLFVEYAKRLSDIGYVVYRFDFSGCGESDGDYEKTSLTKLISDLRSVLKTVSSYQYVEKDNISLIGQSFGTAVIIGSEIIEINKIVLTGSADNPYEVLGNYLGEGFNPSSISVKNGSDKVTTIGPQFWKDLKSYDLSKSIKKFDCPIQFIQGEDEDIVPVEYMQRLAKNAPNHETIIIPNADHGLLPNREEVYKKVVDFLKF